MKLAYLKLDPELQVQEEECFVPVKSALDISNGLSDYYYDVRSNGLLWDMPPTQQYIVPNKPYGYPSIIYGTNSYNHTPFDALYCSVFNGPHGAKDEPNLLDLTYFILSEIHHDKIFLQHRNLGWQFSTNKSYKCKYLATESIAMGEFVTFKAQQLPFYIFQNATVEMQAGLEITVMPGTTIHAGSDVHLYILTPEDCSAHGMIADNQESESMQNQSEGIVQNVQKANSFQCQVYPNPNKGKFIILIECEEANAQIFGLNGLRVHEQHLIRGNNTISLNIASGWYLIQISNEQNVETHKIFIE